MRSADSQSVPWQDYEELVKDIYRVLGSDDGVTIECWGSSCRVEGPPGNYHQIDVLTSHHQGLHQYRTAISCKDWNKRVGIPIVREFAQIVDDAKLSKGVMVSRMGFTAPAKTYAESKNIDLVELRKPLDKDWEGRLKRVHITLVMEQPEICDVQFRLTAPEPDPGKEAFLGGPTSWNLLLNPIFITIPGQEAQAFKNLADEEWSKDPEKGEYDIQFPAGSILTAPDSPEFPADGYLIAGMNFRVKLHPPMTEELVVRADDRIYMIMESVFEGRRFTITTDGEIVEVER